MKKIKTILLIITALLVLGIAPAFSADNIYLDCRYDRAWKVERGGWIGKDKVYEEDSSTGDWEEVETAKIYEDRFIVPVSYDLKGCKGDPCDAVLVVNTMVKMKSRTNQNLSRWYALAQNQCVMKLKGKCKSLNKGDTIAWNLCAILRKP